MYPLRSSRRRKGHPDAEISFQQRRIVGVLQEYDAGANVAELCRKHGISSTTLYKRKFRYGGMGRSELSRLKELESENAELMRLLADSMLNNAGLKGLLEKTSDACRPPHGGSVPDRGLRVRRAPGVQAGRHLPFELPPGAGCSASRGAERAHAGTRGPGDSARLSQAAQDAAQRRVSGQREADLSHGKEEGLELRRPVRKRFPQGGRERSMWPIERDRRWSLDFTEDSLSTGRAFRTANLKDDYTRLPLFPTPSRLLRHRQKCPGKGPRVT